MKPIKVKPMIHAARQAIARGVGSRSGNFALVGWDGKAISGGQDVRLTLPHEKIPVPPSMTVEELSVEMTLAGNRLRAVMPQALESYNPAKAVRDAARKAQMGYGTYRTRRS